MQRINDLKEQEQKEQDFKYKEKKTQRELDQRDPLYFYPRHLKRKDAVVAPADTKPENEPTAPKIDR